MKYTQFSHLDLKLSKIGLGGASLSGESGGYGFGEIGEKGSERIINEAIDCGINVFDTAPIYGFNTSEIRLGKYLGAKREKIHLISKAGITWHSTKRVNLTNDPEVVQKMLHESLKKLQTDYIDIYMIHWPDSKVDIRYALEVLKKAQDVHKIRYIGLCNTNQADFDKSREICKVDFVQSECNLFHDAFDELKLENTIKMGWGTFDKGILAGSVKEDSKFSKEDARSWAPWWKKSNWKEKVKKTQEINKKYNQNSFDLALNYSLNSTDISLCGFKNQKQLDKIINSLELDISSEIMEAVVKDARS